MKSQSDNAGGGQIPGGDAQFVNYKDLAAKFQTKNDMWTFLAVDCGYYLPDKNTVTVYFLRDLMSGKKQRKCPAADAADPLFAADLNCTAIKHLTVPHYETLTTAAIKDKWCAKSITAAHMPEPRDIDYLPRQWIINVCHTLHDAAFRQWVKELCEERNKLR